MFYFWREATAALVPGFLCQSGRRRPENVSILSSLVTDDGRGQSGHLQQELVLVLACFPVLIVNLAILNNFNNKHFSSG